MRNVRNAVLLTVIAAFALSATLGAVPRLEVKRVPERARSFHRVQSGSTIAALSAGNGAKFSFANSWTTSDGLPDDFTTDFIFYTDEMLSTILGFYSLASKNTTVSEVVKDASGTTVFSDSFSGLPEADAINYIGFDLGVLPEGIYKVLVKAKQGKSTVGGTYWVTVSAPPAN